jgi:hypothetical protein
MQRKHYIISILDECVYEKPVKALMEVHGYILQQLKSLIKNSKTKDYRYSEWGKQPTWVLAIQMDVQEHRDEIDLRQQFAPGLSTRIYKAEDGFWIYFGVMRTEPFLSKLYKEFKDYKELDEQMGKYFFDTVHFTLDDFMYVLNNYTPSTPLTGEEKIKIQMAEALDTWISGEEEPGDNQKFAKQLDKLSKHLPPEIKSYSGTLYRGVIVADNALSKCLKQDKPLTYHSRKYSSWSTWKQVAEEFATDEFSHKGYKGVVFAKKFDSSQVVVDIEALAEYLGNIIEKYPSILRFTHSDAQGEILIKLTTADLKFTKKDIYAYEAGNNWRYLKG